MRQRERNVGEPSIIRPSAVTPCEFARYDGIGLAQLIGRGEVAVGEVLEACLKAIEALDPTLNAVVVRMDEESRRFAAALPRPLPASPALW